MVKTFNNVIGNNLTKLWFIEGYIEDLLDYFEDNMNEEFIDSLHCFLNISNVYLNEYFLNLIVGFKLKGLAQFHDDEEDINFFVYGFDELYFFFYIENSEENPQEITKEDVDIIYKINGFDKLCRTYMKYNVVEYGYDEEKIRKDISEMYKSIDFTELTGFFVQKMKGINDNTQDMILYSNGLERFKEVWYNE